MKQYEDLELKINVFWNVILCNLVDVYQRFGGTCCLHLKGRRAMS
jgi:hypothetical protein